MKGEKMSDAEHRAKTKYNAKPASKKARARRNRDRRKAIREGRVKKGDGKDIDHPKGNARGPTRVRSASANRRDNRRGKSKK
jgi:hypothetical protein